MVTFVLKACIQVCPKNPANFNVDNVRVAKLLGGGLSNSLVVRGMVLKSDAAGTIKRMENAKVCITVIYCLLLLSSESLECLFCLDQYYFLDLFFDLGLGGMGLWESHHKQLNM